MGLEKKIEKTKKKTLQQSDYYNMPIKGIYKKKKKDKITEVFSDKIHVS